MPRTVSNPHDLRRKDNRRLTDDARLRLHRALTGAETPKAAAAAFGCTLRALHYYAHLEGFAALLPPPKQPRHTIEHLTPHERSRLVAAVHRGATCNELGKIAKLTRQATHLWLKRSGLQAMWKAKRDEIREQAQQKRFARLAENAESAALMGAATLLAAEGMTVQCIPVVQPTRGKAPTHLYANDRRVRFVEASPFQPNQPYLRFNIHDPAAIYVVSVKDRWYIYIPPYPPGGTIYLNPERAIAHRRPESVPALIVEHQAA